MSGNEAAVDLALLVLRSTLAVVMLAHGRNHIFGGGRIEGTARWFASLGMRPGIVHAWLASITELVVGGLLLVGLLTAPAAAGVIGIMAVAWITNHAGNGFFVFRPGEGWEYVMTLTFAAAALATLGAGDWSLDALLGLTLTPAWGLLVAVGGALAAGLLLAVFWRPARPSVDADA